MPGGLRIGRRQVGVRRPAIDRFQLIEKRRSLRLWNADAEGGGGACDAKQ